MRGQVLQEGDEDARGRAPHRLARELEEVDGTVRPCREVNALGDVPALFAVDVGVEQLRDRDIEDTDDLARIASELGAAGEQPDERREHEPTGDRRHAVELGDDLDQRRIKADLLLRLAQGGVTQVGVDTGLELAPGNAISP